MLSRATAPTVAPSPTATLTTPGLGSAFALPASVGAVEAEYATRRRRERTLLISGILAVDVLALSVAVVSAGTLRLYVDAILPINALGFTERHVLASILVVPILLVLFAVQGRYKLQNCLIGPREYAQIAHATTYGVILAVVLSYFAGGEPLLSRAWLLLVWLFSLVCVCSGRFISRHVVRRLRRRGMLRTRVIIVGASSVGLALAEQFRAGEGEGIDVVGFLDEYLTVGHQLLPGVRVLGRPGDLLHNNRASSIDEFILVPQALPHERLEEITQLMVAREGPIVRMAVNSGSLLTHGVLVTHRSSVPLLTLQRARINGLDIFLKRGLDIVGSVFALIGLSPLVLGVVLNAVARGRYPLLVRHTIQTAGGSAGVELCLLNRAITGWLLVRGAPAFVAVLRGELSLVGPRPMPRSGPDDFRSLSLAAINPGLTGPWRLSGPHASREEQALEDLSYVRNYSIWEDLRVLWVSARRLLLPATPPVGLVRWQDQPLKSRMGGDRP